MTLEELYPDIICSLTHEIMKDPIITNNGISYEKNAILTWLKINSICPITNSYLDETLIVPNIQLKNTICNLKKYFIMPSYIPYTINNTIKEDETDNKCCIIT